MPEDDAGATYGADPEYLGYARREALNKHDQPELTWDM